MRFVVIFMVVFLELFAQELPKWVAKLPSPYQKGIYFVGVSKWYVKDDTRMLPLAKKDALQNGYAQISDYFGLNIKSTFDMKKSVYNGNISTTFKSHITTKTNQLIFDIKPIKKFIQKSEDGKNFCIYYLLLLTKATENKIKAEMKKDEYEFKELQKQIIDAIDKKEYYKSKNLIEVAKGKRSAYIDDTISQLEKRLNALIAGQLHAKIEIEKTTFLPGENIAFSVILNKNGYLYLFYETPEEIDMLYPNIYRRNEYVRANVPVVFPDVDNDLYVNTYKEDIGKKVQLVAIASKKLLDIKSLAVDKDEGIYIYDKNSRYKNIIKECLKNNFCTQTIIPLKVSKHIGMAIGLGINANEEIKRKLFRYLRSKGIASKKSQKKIQFTIHKTSKYSQSLGITVTSYSIEAKAYKNTKQIKEINDECSEDDFRECVYEIYLDLVKLF